MGGLQYIYWSSRTKKEFDMINRADMLIGKETGLSTEDLKAISFVEYFELFSSCLNQIKASQKK